MHDKGKLRFGPKTVLSAIYDWLNTCDSIPNFDGVLISTIVFLLGCLLIGFMFLAGSLSRYRHEPSVQPSLASTTQLLRSADDEVRQKFGRPRTTVFSKPEASTDHSAQELFGQASAAPTED
jgi:hypothetical protein